MITERWGVTAKGEQIYRYTLQNDNGMKVGIINYGAIISSIEVPDKNGVIRDVVLGYDSLEEYEQGSSSFGALIGRNANRISNAECSIEGVVYKLEENQPGYNLHSGSNNLAVQVWNHDDEAFKDKSGGLEDSHKDESAESIWKAKEIVADSVALHYRSEDMDEGFPGNMELAVIYSLTENNTLIIEYFAKTDKTTIINLTNHSYFNLAGHEHGSIYNQKLRIEAEQYVPVQKGNCIPKGDLAYVEGTPMDFRIPKNITEDISGDFEQISISGGYDHCYVLDESDRMGEVELAAEAVCEDTGISMTVYTDCPGIQLYTANGLSDEKGKQGAVYNSHCAFCLETEAFPDSINQEKFTKPLITPQDKYYSMTAYAFANSDE